MILLRRPGTFQLKYPVRHIICRTWESIRFHPMIFVPVEMHVAISFVFLPLKRRVRTTVTFSSWYFYSLHHSILKIKCSRISHFEIDISHSNNNFQLLFLLFIAMPFFTCSSEFLFVAVLVSLYHVRSCIFIAIPVNIQICLWFSVFVSCTAVVMECIPFWFFNTSTRES